MEFNDVNSRPTVMRRFRFIYRIRGELFLKMLSYRNDIVKSPLWAVCDRCSSFALSKRQMKHFWPGSWRRHCQHLQHITHAGCWSWVAFVRWRHWSKAMTNALYLTDLATEGFYAPTLFSVESAECCSNVWLRERNFYLQFNTSEIPSQNVTIAFV